MDDCIYIVDPETKQLTEVRSVPFSDIGVSERTDLEQWVINNPEILGEDLLVISTEYDRFTTSSKRLDVLALDGEGRLVIVELKLAACGSFADLQAIRYAAFCSAMTMDDAIDALARFRRCTRDEAQATVTAFLDTDEPVELDNQPRIILAAGSMDDQEIASCVLWLRSFGVDITCVELTPYRFSDTGRILLVPKVIIPLPEAKDYVVSVEKKEVAVARKARTALKNAGFWQALTEEYAKLQPPLPVGRVTSNHTVVHTGLGTNLFHYEWLLIRKGGGKLTVAFHCESPDRDANFALANAMQTQSSRICEGIGETFDISPWGKRNARVRFLLPFDGDAPPLSLVPRAAELMKTFVERTFPIVRQCLEKG